MDINPKEIESIRHIGHLHGEEVKLIKCIGGFNLVVGKKAKTNKKAEVITAGSHPAICIHEMQKMFKTDFKLKMAKSEHEVAPTIEDHTDMLAGEMSNNGIKLYSLEKPDSLEVVLYKHGITLSTYALHKSAQDNQLDMINGNTNFFQKINDEEKLGLARSIAKLIESKVGGN